MKDLLKDLKKGDLFKNREAEKEEINRKCQEIFIPPGIIHVEETALKKVSTCPNEIKNTVPSDNIFKRHKVEQRITQNTNPWKSSIIKKAETIVIPTGKNKGKIMPVQEAVIDKDQLKALYKEHQLDVQCEKESANDVNFEKLF